MAHNFSANKRISLLKELGSYSGDGCYKHLAPIGAKPTIDLPHIRRRSPKELKSVQLS